MLVVFKRLVVLQKWKQGLVQSRLLVHIGDLQVEGDRRDVEDVLLVQVCLLLQAEEQVELLCYQAVALKVIDDLALVDF